MALGEKSAGLFSNDEQFANDLHQIGQKSLELNWRLPILSEHRETMKGQHSDLSNSGKTRYGGASSAAAFLENFVEKGVKWVHLDIAGPAHSKEGCTGFGVYTLMDYLKLCEESY